MIMIETDNRFSVHATENHEMLVRHGGMYKKVLLKDLKSTHKIPMAGFASGNNNTLTNYEKLAIATQADGCIVGSTIQFSFSKQRKINEFLSLMNSGDFRFSEVQGKVGCGNTQSTRRWIVRPDNAITKNVRQHISLSDMSLSKARDIIEYMNIWDGSVASTNTYLYTTTDKSSCDFYQAVASLSGYKSMCSEVVDDRKESYKKVYRLFITKRNEVTCQSIKKMYTEYSGNVYCVTVPDGNIVVRRNGKVMIAGNCHFFGSDSYNQIVSMFPNAKYLGVTATPFRQNKYMTNLFDKVSYSCSTKDMIDLGHLVPPVLTYFSFDRENIPNMVNQVYAIHNLHHFEKKGIIFLKTIADCNDFKKLMIMRGLGCESITSEVVDDARDEMLSKFRAGEKGSPDILVTVNVLTAGFDSPNVCVIYMPYETKSVVTYIQRVGRGLRLHEGKDKCDVYVGGDSPNIISEYYSLNDKAIRSGSNERIQKEHKLVEQSKKIRVEDWDSRVGDLINEMRSSATLGIASMVVDKKFYKEMLDVMLKSPPIKQTKTHAKVPPTDGQKRFLTNIGMYDPNLTKHEANYILNRYQQSQGNVSDGDMVKSGKFAGRMWGEVPHAYKHYLINYPDSPVAKDYKRWLDGLKQKVRGT